MKPTGVLRDYLRGLLVPWKLGTFLAATAALTWLGRPDLVSDFTRDRPMALLMCLATYVTAPFAVTASSSAGTAAGRSPGSSSP